MPESACRSWQSGRRRAPSRSAAGRHSPISARPSPSGSESGSAVAGRRSFRTWSHDRMAIDPRPGDTPADDRVLVVLRERAFAAMERAYAPYSNFRVGAALLASDGSISEGCNVENAAYPAGICAERGAVSAAVARGNRSFETIMIATEADQPTPPCGMCRQVLEEFSPHLIVVSATRDGREARWTLDELLPKAFTPHSLDRR